MGDGKALSGGYFSKITFQLITGRKAHRVHNDINLPKEL